MSILSNESETKLLEAIFLATTWLSLLEDKVTAPYTQVYISLHTADPGEAGDQTTNECAYTSYARVAVARSGAGWTVTGDTCDNDAAITFPTATGGSETIQYVGIGWAVSGAGNLFASIAVAANLAVSSGITPEIAAGDLDVIAA